MLLHPLEVGHPSAFRSAVYLSRAEDVVDKRSTAGIDSLTRASGPVIAKEELKA